MATGYERDADDRLDDLEATIHGDGDAEPGLAGIINGIPDKRRGMLEVLGDHDRRIKALEPPAGMIRDWFTVTDPQTAVQWLDELDQWRGRVLDHIKPGLIDRPCWLYHPTVVGRLITLHGAWILAHKGRIDSVLALWCRYLEDMTKPVVDELGKCESGKHTTDYAHYWAVSEGDQDAIRGDYVKWWCGVREGVPPGLMPA